jgi:hypothetical protein
MLSVSSRGWNVRNRNWNDKKRNIAAAVILIFASLFERLLRL